MRSVADLLKLEDRRVLAALDAGERVALALRLGARYPKTFRCAHDPPLTPAAADRLLRRRRQQGRRPSRCLQRVVEPR
jgi:hypothetical protein